VNDNTVLIVELVWMASGMVLGAMAALRHDSLAWLIGGLVFGPLIVIALVHPRRSVLRGGRR
jgi:hypothetical protein